MVIKIYPALSAPLGGGMGWMRAGGTFHLPFWEIRFLRGEVDEIYYFLVISASFRVFLDSSESYGSRLSVEGLFLCFRSVLADIFNFEDLMYDEEERSIK
jgi:hypothetical protein